MRTAHRDEPVYKVCLGCIKHPALERYVRKHGSRVSQCRFCGSRRQLAVNSTDSGIGLLFRALVRFHYAEVEYNTHFGGDEVPTLLQRDNPLLHCPSPALVGDWEVAVMDMLESAYASYRKGISLYAGNYKGMRLALPSLVDGGAEKIGRWAKELQIRNAFDVEDKILTVLRKMRSPITARVARGEVLFRARIGFEVSGTPMVGGGLDPNSHYKPYEAAALGAPPPPMSRPGRMNRDGFSFLYLASDKRTAVAEVRPHPGHFVSVGQFRVRNTLRIADFGQASIDGFCRNDESLDRFGLICALDQLFATPILPEERTKYLLTQTLADVIRKIGYDGIRFTSSVGSGTNLTIFRAGACEYVKGSACVVRVKSLQYKCTTLRTMGNPNDYMLPPDYRV